MFYFGVYYYSIGCYSKVFRIVKICKNRLFDLFVIYNEIVDKYWYVKYFGNLFIGERMKYLMYWCLLIILL